MYGKAVDYVFVGSCTNGRIEDLRLFARLVEGRRKADNITAWIVPGSKGVEAAAQGPRDWTGSWPKRVSNSASRAVRRAWR